MSSGIAMKRIGGQRCHLAHLATASDVSLTRCIGLRGVITAHVEHWRILSRAAAIHRAGARVGTI